MKIDVDAWGHWPYNCVQRQQHGSGDEKMIYDINTAYEKIINGIAESDADCWVQPSESEYACDVYLFDPELNEGDSFDGSESEKDEIIKKVSTFMENRVRELNASNSVE